MTTQTRVRAILEAARTLISDPNNWVQHCEAVTAAGSPARPRDDEACRWCAVGAIRKCASAGEYAAYVTATTYDGIIVSHTLQALDDAARYIFQTVDACRHSSVTDINDYEGHARTLQMFDRAIAQMSEKASERERAREREMGY